MELLALEPELQVSLLQATSSTSASPASHVPLSQIMTVPPPYSPSGMIPSNSVVLDRMVLDLHREALDGRIVGRPLRDRPGEHARRPTRGGSRSGAPWRDASGRRRRARARRAGGAFFPSGSGVTPKRRFRRYSSRGMRLDFSLTLLPNDARHSGMGPDGRGARSRRPPPPASFFRQPARRGPPLPPGRPRPGGVRRLGADAASQDSFRAAADLLRPRWRSSAVSSGSSARRGRPATARRFWGPEETRAAALVLGRRRRSSSSSAPPCPRSWAPRSSWTSPSSTRSRGTGRCRRSIPWMAGKTINYYYWGYLLAATLAKLASVTPFVSYNLAVATFAGYTFVAAACLGRRLSDGSRAAALGSGFVAVFAGNVQGALDAIRAPFDKGFDYWHASRVIANGDTINEFPFFTFFHADLHPHLLAFPYYVAAFVFAHRLFEGRGADRRRARCAAAPQRLRLRPLRLRGRHGDRGQQVEHAVDRNRPGLAAALSTDRRPEPARRSARLVRGGLLGGPLLPRGARPLAPQLAHLSASQQRPRARRRSSRASSSSWACGGSSSPWASSALWPRAAGETKARGGGATSSSRRPRARRSSPGSSAKAGPAAARLSRASRPGAGRPRAARGQRRRTRTASSPSLLLLLALGMIGGCEFIYFKDSYGTSSSA